MLPVLNSNSWFPTVFDDMFNDDFMPRMNATAPAINVKEDEHQYEVDLAVPGMQKQDFNVNISDDGCLCIKMEHKDEKEKDEKKSHYLRREFNYTKFEQRLQLPDDVDGDKITAKVEDGVLHVVLPRVTREETKVGRHIEIA